MYFFKGELQTDAVFTPGHCCVTGLLPSYIFSKGQLSLENFVRDSTKQHFSLAPHELFTLSKDGGIFKYAERFAPGQSLFAAHDYARCFMEFGWQERQAKFIGNSVRVYEFFGYDWWMPLWDKGFVEFWEGVPLALRKEREWYKEYVGNQFDSLAGKKAPERLPNASDPPDMLARVSKSWAGQIIRKSSLLKKAAKIIVSATQSDTDVMKFRFDELSRKDLIARGYSSNGLAAYFFVHENSNDVTR